MYVGVCRRAWLAHWISVRLCNPCSIPALVAIVSCGLRLWLVGFPGFPSFIKTGTSKFQFDLDEGRRLMSSHTVYMRFPLMREEDISVNHFVGQLIKDFINIVG